MRIAAILSSSIAYSVKRWARRDAVILKNSIRIDSKYSRCFFAFSCTIEGQESERAVLASSQKTRSVPCTKPKQKEKQSCSTRAKQ
eukprot:scaffold292_cov376-Prasinococcus_capsulatus_cf.AAC.3